MSENYIHKLKSNKQKYILQYNGTHLDLTEQNYAIANSPLNEYKNNFPDVLASEETRVKLDDSMYYINANYILDNYIATQQPNENTYDDFWEMIYEKRCSLIVNLSGNNEYLPNGKTTYGNYDVIVKNINHNDVVKIKNIVIIKRDDLSPKINLYHVTFTMWPDFGVPDKRDFSRLFDAINMVDYVSLKGPIVVHCRAGIGRTGTFIMIHYLLRKFNSSEFMDPFDVLISMRKARCGMVQKRIQFEFAFDFVCDKISTKALVPIKKNKLSLSCGESNRFNKNRNKLSSSTGIVT
jgi:protein tyrosine phosphatase